MDDYCQYNLFAKPRPNLFLAPPYAKKSEGLKDNRANPTLNLKVSDPCKLLLLMESLKDVPSRDLELKINTYLAEGLKATAVFMMDLVSVPNEAIIRVIGSNILPLDIHMPATDNLITEIIDTKEGMEFNLYSLNTQLLEVIKSSVPAAWGCVYGFPIFEQININGITSITDTPTLLVFVISSAQQKSFASLYVQETLRFCQPVLVSAIRCEEETRQKLQTQAILMITGRLFSFLTVLEELLEEIVEEAKSLADCERGSLYLIDDFDKYLMPCVFDGNNNITRPKQEKDKGVLGKCFMTGNTLNIKDPQNSPLFSKCDDIKHGLKTKNILCFPIRDEGVILGVVQLCNKNVGDFNVFDEEAVTVFGIYAGASIRQTLDFRLVQEALKRNQISTDLLLYHMQIRESDVKHLLYAQMPDCPDFGEITFNAHIVPSHQTLLLIMKMFSDLDFIETFQIDKQALAFFLCYVDKGYQRQPFHNWMHAFAVTHFAFSIIKTFELIQKGVISDIEAMAIIIACICHDIDHKGSGNMYLMRPDHNLESLASCIGSVMEKHHMSQTVCILNTEGCNFLSKLNEKNYAKCLELIKSNIVATNLAVHSKHIRQQELILTRIYDSKNPMHRFLLSSLIMTCADLSDQTRGWKAARVAATQLHEEYFRYGDLDKALGKRCIHIMDREKASIPDLQIEFLRDICLPAFSVLVKIFPALEFCVRSVLYNIRCWEVAKRFFAFKEISCITSMDVLTSDQMSFTESELILMERGGEDDPCDSFLEEKKFNCIDL